MGGDTAELFKDAARQAIERFKPAAMLVGSSCTAELIQDDPGGLAHALKLDIPVIPLELPSYQRKENWGASETFYQLCRHLVLKPEEKTAKIRPSCNILGPSAARTRCGGALGAGEKKIPVSIASRYPTIVEYGLS